VPAMGARAVTCRGVADQTSLARTGGGPADVDRGARHGRGAILDARTLCLANRVIDGDVADVGARPRRRAASIRRVRRRELFAIM
jgi:hypothetical protein